MTIGSAHYRSFRSQLYTLMQEARGSLTIALCGLADNGRRGGRRWAANDIETCGRAGTGVLTSTKEHSIQCVLSNGRAASNCSIDTVSRIHRRIYNIVIVSAHIYRKPVECLSVCDNRERYCNPLVLWYVSWDISPYDCCRCRCLC